MKDQSLMDYEKPSKKNDNDKKSSHRVLDAEKKKADIHKKPPSKPSFPADREKWSYFWVDVLIFAYDLA